jgi:hypothetical protein
MGMAAAAATTAVLPRRAAAVAMKTPAAKHGWGTDNNQQSTKSSDGNGNDNGDVDRVSDDDEKEGDVGAESGGWRQKWRIFAKLFKRCTYYEVSTWDVVIRLCFCDQRNRFSSRSFLLSNRSFCCHIMFMLPIHPPSNNKFKMKATLKTIASSDILDLRNFLSYRFAAEPPCYFGTNRKLMKRPS